MPGYRFIKKDKTDMTDAVGDILVREKRRRAIKLQAKIVGWLIVVLVILSLILLFTKVAHS